MKLNPKINDLKLLIFSVIFIVYGSFSYSAPMQLGVAEFGIALLLFLVLDFGYVLTSLSRIVERREVLDAILCSTYLILLFLFSIIGIYVNQNEINAFLRDVIPMTTFFLPIFIIPSFRYNRLLWESVFTHSLCFVGVAFSIRHFISSDLSLTTLGSGIIVGENSYFSNPAVLFAAIYLPSFSLICLFRRQYYRFLVFLSFGLVAVAPLIAVLLRAQIFLILLCLIVALPYYAKRYGRFVSSAFILGLLLFFLISSVDVAINSFIELVVAKTNSVGALNARDEEAKAVLTILTEDAASFLFGTGWGGVMYNPAAGGKVGFTHNFFMFILFKTGLLGFILFSVYVMLIIRRIYILFKSVGKNPSKLPLGMAIAGVCLVNLLIEAGYKMLTFGVVLALLWIATSREYRNVNK